MVAISNVILIDSNINNEVYKQFIQELETIWYLKIKSFKNVKEAINYLKIIEFVETKIIIGGELYIEFINYLINNLNDIKVIPKIAIYTSQKQLFIIIIKNMKILLIIPFIIMVE